MWLYTKHGIFSANLHRSNPKIVHLKSKFSGDLERLFNNKKILQIVTEMNEGEKVVFGKVKKATAFKDFDEYCEISKDVWCALCTAMTATMDYSKFGDVIKSNHKLYALYGRVYNMTLNF